MSDKAKMYATCRIVVQTGPDSWEPETRVLEVQHTTTVSEVMAWRRGLDQVPANTVRHLDCVLSVEPVDE